MKTKFFKLFALTAFFAGFTFAAHATDTPGTVSVTVRLADQLSVVKVTDVDFGGIFIPAEVSGATLVMAHDGTCAFSGTPTAVYQENLRTAGQLNVYTGTDNAFKITYNSGQIDMGGNGVRYTPQLYKPGGAALNSSTTDTYNSYADAVSGDVFYPIKVGGSMFIPATAYPQTLTQNFTVVVTWP